jgi:hypothetical protein
VVTDTRRAELVSWLRTKAGYAVPSWSRLMREAADALEHQEPGHCSAPEAPCYGCDGPSCPAYQGRQPEDARVVTDERRRQLALRLDEAARQSRIPEVQTELVETAKALVAPTERELALEQWVSDLQADTYINCVYCGHRYGPDSEVPATMADVLKEHVEQCSAHPMAALKRRALGLDAIVHGEDLARILDYAALFAALDVQGRPMQALLAGVREAISHDGG